MSFARALGFWVAAACVGLPLSEVMMAQAPVHEPARLVLASEEVGVGVPLGVWVIAASDQPFPAAVTVSTPSNATIASPSSDGCVSAATGTNSWSGTMTAHVLPLCMTPREGGAVRLVASIEKPAGAPRSIAVSETVTATEWYEFGAVVGAAVSSLLLFVAGMFTTGAQKWYEEWRAQKKDDLEIQKSLAAGLAKEFARNRYELVEFLANRAPAPTLNTGAFISLGDHVKAYLKERGNYWEPMRRVYATEIAAYNRSLTIQPQATAVHRKLAAAALKAIDATLSKTTP
jgi:hypothetical protein